MPGLQAITPDAAEPGPLGFWLIILIREMNQANPLWGASRIHGELLKLGITLAQRTVGNYMVRRARRPSSLNWKAFLRNHLGSMISVDSQRSCQTLEYDLC